MTNVQAKRRRRWTLAQWHAFLINMSTLGAFFMMGFAAGSVWR